MIKVSGISKSFGEIKAVNDVSFDIGKGVVALLGANGAGKTTLIRMIMGYYPTLSGKIEVLGIDISKNRTKPLESIAYIPENNPLYQDLSAYEFIKLVANLYSVSKKDFEKRLKLLVEELDIKNIINQKISTLSKGYKRRVAIAGALIHKPKIMILDEPTDGLDPNQKILIRNLLKEYGKDNLVLISTHIMEDVEIMADRVLLMNEGTLLIDESLKKLKTNNDSNSLIDIFSKVTKKG